MSSFLNWIDAIVEGDVEQWRRDHPHARPIWTERDGMIVLWLHDHEQQQVCCYRIIDPTDGLLITIDPRAH